MIFSNFDTTYSISDQVTFKNKTCELRYWSFIFNQRNNTFDAQVFAMHVKIFSKWWHQRGNEKIII